MVADHHPGPGRCQGVPGDHGPRRGGDVEVAGAEPAAHQDSGPGELGRDAVTVAAEGHQSLRRDGAGDGQGGRERRRRRRAQRLAGGDGGHGGLAVRGRAQPDVAAPGAPGVQELLGLLGRDVVGQGAPEPLGRDMVGLLDYAFAVAAPRRARPHGHAVVLGHRGERRGDPAGFGVHDGGHPVEPPRRGEPAQGAGDTVQALDQVRLVHRRGQPAAPPPRMRQRPDQQARLGAPAPARGRAGQFHPVPLGLIAGRVLDHRHRPALRGMARLAVRAQAPRPQLPGERRDMTGRTRARSPRRTTWSPTGAGPRPAGPRNR